MGLIAIAAAAFLAFGANDAVAENALTPTIMTGVVQHGGGCRKSSPPGQCCHMDNSTGTVHCHWRSRINLMLAAVLVGGHFAVGPYAVLSTCPPTSAFGDG